MGNRIGKSNFDGTNTNSTWYIRDASGNNMATYNRHNDQGLYIDEFNIYGSSRLGTFKPHWPYPVTSQSPSSAYSKYFAYPSGYKQYELTNHLGNVNGEPGESYFPNEQPTQDQVTNPMGQKLNTIGIFNFNVAGAAPAAKQSHIDEMMLYYSGGTSYSEGEKKDKVTHTMDNNGNVTSEPSK